jgi:hypothetical protein
LNNFIRSLIRTGVPYIVGALLSWLTTQGISISPEGEAGLIAFLTALFGGVYYLVVRALETRWPIFGVLLGATTAPEYLAYGDLEELETLEVSDEA